MRLAGAEPVEATAGKGEGVPQPRKNYLAGSSPPTVPSSSTLLRRYYRGYDEWGRLVRDPYHRLEFETTLHFLRRYLSRTARVLDAGGGPGRYAIELAKWGHQVTLLDLFPEHLEIARRQIQRVHVEGRVQRVVRGSIDDLSRFRDGEYDAVLCLGGALGHLVDRRRRRRALREIVRVAAKRSPVFVSVIGRFGLLEGGLAVNPQELQEDPALYRRALRTGDYDGHRGFAPCHFFTPDELGRCFGESGLQVLASVGLEGLASQHVRATNALARRFPAGWAAWQRMHLRICTDPAIVATSVHFMVIGSKR